MQTLAVILIVAIAGVFVVSKFRKKAVSEEGCDCGCSSCELTDTCSEKEENNSDS
jgi:hypothetical protein